VGASAIRKVLLVDDDADLRRLGKLSLGKIGGWEVVVAASGEAAVDLAARELPDVVLMDVSMPGMDGCAALAKLREEPKTAAIPIVFMTARALPDEVARLVALGAAGVITKPFDVMDLPTQLLALLTSRGEAVAPDRGGPTSPAHDGLVAMRREYVAALPSRVEELAAAVVQARRPSDAGSVEAARTLAHKLRGSAGSHGLAAVSEAAGRIEDALGAVTVSGARAWDEIDAALARLHAEVK
jgi:CheY-like chemotaxis protein